MTTCVELANRVHEFLLSPKAYPEKPQRVELRETHISWVYLTERYVYKQKKPVTFEFLDFSTREKRQYYCDQEVKLNRRLSPEVYLGVVPVSTDPHGNLQLKPGDEVVEPLVKMVRLDESSTLEATIRNDTLTALQIQRLSNMVTRFYTAQAPAMLRSSQFIDGIQQHIIANGNDLLTTLPQANYAIRRISNSQLRCLRLESDYFIQRVADGRVVDGHGDLRPDHIYFQRGKPAIIDCIEFNPEYRTNDVVDELAFLTMECDRLGNHDVGESIMNAYLEASNDTPAPFLSSFYRSYRACVRAKVAALRATQEGLPDTTKTAATELAQDYVQLAKRYTAEFGKPIVIMVGGLSGTGKSTLANALRSTLYGELLQTDVIRNELFTPESSNGKYTAAGRQQVYQAMVDRIANSLSRTPTIVLDGTYSKQTFRQSVYEKANELDATVLQVQCQCAPETAVARIATRLDAGNDHSDATPEVYDSQSESYEEPLDCMPRVTIDTSQIPIDGQVREVISFVRQMCRS